MPATDDTRDLTLQLHKLTLLMDRVAEMTLKEARLTSAEFHLLLALRHHGTLSQKAVARFRGLTEGAVSRKVDALIRQRVIIRTQNPANRREQLLTLTTIGQQRLTTATQALTRAFASFQHALRPKERAELGRLLGKLLATFWEDGKRLYCGPKPVTRQTRS